MNNMYLSNLTVKKQVPGHGMEKIVKWLLKLRKHVFVQGKALNSSKLHPPREGYKMSAFK